MTSVFQLTGNPLGAQCSVFNTGWTPDCFELLDSASTLRFDREVVWTAVRP